MIVILSSEAGKGKSFQAGTFEEPIIWIDLENRVKRTVDAYYSDKIIDIRQCLVYTTDFKEDHIKTLENLEKELKNIKDATTITLDGIGDIRDMAHTKWCVKNKRKHAVNPGDWEEVNDIVRDYIFPLINYCRANSINLVMTAQFKDDYAIDKTGQSSKVGRVPALKEWMMYNTDTLIILEVRNKKYWASCTKSLVGIWEKDITDLNLFDVLLELGV